jgi:hypothetical protein
MNEEKLAKLGNFLIWFLLFIAAFLPFIKKGTIQEETKPQKGWDFDLEDVVNEVGWMRRDSRKVLRIIQYVALFQVFLLVIAIALGVAAAF